MPHPWEIPLESGYEPDTTFSFSIPTTPNSASTSQRLRGAIKSEERQDLIHSILRNSEIFLEEAQSVLTIEVHPPQ